MKKVILSVTALLAMFVVASAAQGQAVYFGPQLAWGGEMTYNSG